MKRFRFALIILLGLAALWPLSSLYAADNGMLQPRAVIPNTPAAAQAPIITPPAQQAPAADPTQELRDTLQAAPKLKTPEINPYQDLPDEYIKEAHYFFTNCQAGTLSQYYNCQCLAMKYLDARIDKGPRVDQTSILQSIVNTCQDATNAAGREYTDCKANAVMYPPEIPIDDYCTCYVRTYTKLYEESGVALSSTSSIQMRTQAHVMCQDPALAPTLYPPHSKK